MEGPHSGHGGADAIVDEAGLLVAANDQLLELQLAAGGEAGGALTIPALAQLCRDTRRLGASLTRNIVAADREESYDIRVRSAMPEGADGPVALHVVDWLERAAPATIATDPPDINTDEVQLRTDRTLRVVAADADAMTTQRVVGQDVRDLFDVIPPSARTAWLGKIDERQPVFGQRVRERRGLKRLYLLTAHPVITSSGRYAGYRVALRPDEEQTAGKPEKSALLDQALFGSRLGPVLRQPLGKIIANAETIGERLEGPLRADYAGYAKDIADAGRHLVALVDDLSDLEAIDRDGFTVASDRIDLVDLAHRAAGLLAVKAADHHITIDIPSESDNCPAIGEFRRVLQVLVNLLGNAIRYSPDGSRVRLRVKSEADSAAITVTDEGPGIPAEDHDRVFEKFERLGRSGDGGSGLGLFISRRLATAMNGDLTVESEPGQGAAFTLTLPADPAA